MSNPTAAALRQKYPADDLIKNFGACAKSRISSISELGTRLGLTMPPSPEPALLLLPEGPEPDLDLDDLSSFFEKTTSGLVQNALAGLEEEPATTPAIEVVDHSTEASKTPAKSEATPTQTTAKVDLMTDYKELEALVAESTSNYVKTTLHGLSPVPYQPTVPTSTGEPSQISKATQLTIYSREYGCPIILEPASCPQSAPILFIHTNSS